MKSRSILVVIILGAIGLAGYKLLGNRAKAQSQAFQKQYEKDYAAGHIKPLDGPFVEPGNIDELQFRVIRLPKISVQSMSFDGDLLCVADVKARPQTWMVIDRDGNTKASFQADRAYMTRTGKVVSFLGDSDHSIGITFTDTSGQKRHLNDNSYATSITWTGPPVFTSMGFFDSAGKVNEFQYYDPQLNPKNIKVPGGGFYLPVTEDQPDGTVGNVYPQVGGNTDRLGFFKDGKISDESISIPHEYFKIISSKNFVAVTSGRAFQERVPYRRTAPNRYERLAVPQSSLGADLLAINDRGDYVLSVTAPMKQVHTEKQMPYDFGTYLVTGGKYYNLRHIHQMLFGTSDLQQGAIESAMLDEYGDMVATTENGAFLIQPLTSSSP